MKFTEVSPGELKPVESAYTEIIKEFIDTGYKCAKLEGMDIPPQTIAVSARMYLNRNGIDNVTVHRRKDAVYLLRRDL